MVADASSVFNVCYIKNWISSKLFVAGKCFYIITKIVYRKVVMDHPATVHRPRLCMCNKFPATWLVTDAYDGPQPDAKAIDKIIHTFSASNEITSIDQA